MSSLRKQGLSKDIFLPQKVYKYKLKNINCRLDLDLQEEVRTNSDLIITKPDKGKRIVVLNQSGYIAKTKTREILNDNSKFKKLKSDWLKAILKIED